MMRFGQKTSGGGCINGDDSSARAHLSFLQPELAMHVLGLLRRTRGNQLRLLQAGSGERQSELGASFRILESTYPDERFWLLIDEAHNNQREESTES